MKFCIILVVGLWSLPNINSDGIFGGQRQKQSPPKKPLYLFNREGIKRISEMESYIYKYLSKYTGHLQEQLDLLKRYMLDYELSSVNKIVETDDEPFNEKWRSHMQIANPFLLHRLIRRYAVDLNDIMNSLKTSNDADLLGLLHHLDDEVNGFPNREDYKESLNSLLRIQKYSDINALEFSNGIMIPGDERPPLGLTDRDVIDLGKKALEMKELSAGVEWLEVAMNKINPGEEDESPLNKSLQKLVQMHDTLWSQKNGTMNSLFSSKINSNFGPHCPHREKVMDVKKRAAKLYREEHLNRKDMNYSSHIKNNFLSLCAGHQLQTEEEKSRLYCYYERRDDPYLLLNPLKTEILNESPPLIQIYDILNENEINEFISRATPYLERSRVANEDEDDLNEDEDEDINDIASERTSLQTWLGYHDEETQWLDRVTTKIEMATQLNVKDISELYQVATYGTSHHYDEHIDAFVNSGWIEKYGNRIATFMIYLTDVEVGGLTAFPVFGTAATPIKGSAVFWYNLLETGEPDHRTYHGACPIVHGIKWVVNKWILSNGNWNKRKCHGIKDTPKS